MKTTTAFAALAANRTAGRREAMQYAIVSINKDGTPSKTKPNELCMAVSMEKAQTILARMEKMNPNSTFTIINL